MRSEQKDGSRDSRREPSVISSAEATRKDSFLREWLAFRANPLLKEEPLEVFLRLRKEEVKAAIKSTAEHCIADYLQNINGGQVIDLLSDSDSRPSQRQKSPSGKLGQRRESMVEEDSRREGSGGKGRKEAGGCQEGEIECVVKGEPFLSEFPWQKGKKEEVDLQDVGLQVSSADGNILEVVDIREEEGEEAIYVLQHNRLTTYSRHYLEQYHIAALIKYYEKLMHTKRRQNAPLSTRRSFLLGRPAPFPAIPREGSRMSGQASTPPLGQGRSSRQRSRERRGGNDVL